MKKVRTDQHVLAAFKVNQPYFQP